MAKILKNKITVFNDFIVSSICFSVRNRKKFELDYFIFSASQKMPRRIDRIFISSLLRFVFI
jgi:hypothetical protein